MRFLGKCGGVDDEIEAIHLNETDAGGEVRVDDGTHAILLDRVSARWLAGQLRRWAGEEPAEPSGPRTHAARPYHQKLRFALKNIATLKKNAMDAADVVVTLDGRIGELERRLDEWDTERERQRARRGNPPRCPKGCDWCVPLPDAEGTLVRVCGVCGRAEAVGP